MILLHKFVQIFTIKFKRICLDLLLQMSFNWTTRFETMPVQYINDRLVTEVLATNRSFVIA